MAKPTLLLLHGLFGGLSNWEHVLRHFGNTCHVMVPPLPIYESHAQDSLDHLVRYLENYIDALPEAPVLIGNSLGGHVALLYAHRHPHRVRQLVLTGSSGLYENTSMGSYPRRGTYAYIKERVAYTFYDPAVATPTLIDEVYNITTDNRRCLHIIRTAKSAQRNNVAHLLPEITVPSLLIWGEDDKITPPDVAYEFKNGLPDASLVMLPHCGHAPMMERPEDFNTALETFLQAS